MRLCQFMKLAAFTFCGCKWQLMSCEKRAPRLAVQITHGLYTWLQFLPAALLGSSPLSV
jgi:hypothetical protein